MGLKKMVAAGSGLLVYFGSLSGVNAAPADEGAAKENIAELTEVVVTDSRVNASKITLITAAEIKAKGAQTVAEALKDVAGLSVTGSNVRGKKYGQMRGSDANSTKVIIDGVMLSSVGDARMDLSLIDTDNIEKIEVFKGPVPVIYGTNAPGGVIFITTKNGGGKNTGTLSLARGGWDTETYSASFSGHTGKVNYYFGARKQNTDGHITHAAENSEYYNGKLRWDLNPKASLTVFGSYADITRQLPNRYDEDGNLLNYPGPGGVISQQNNYFGGGMNPNPFGSTYDWEYDPFKQSYMGAVYNQKLPNGSNLSLKIYQSDQKSFLTTSGYQNVDWDGSVKGYELQHAFKPNRANTVTWGYTHETRSFVERTRNADWITYNRADYDYTGKSYYLQDVLNVTPRLAMSFGYRHNEDTDHVIVTKPNGDPVFPTYSGVQDGTFTSDNPVFSLIYTISENTALHGSIGKSYRFPNAMERSAPGGYYNYLNSSDGVCDYLLPEEAINREIGLSHAMRSGLSIDVTYFKKGITNMIKGQGQGQARIQYENIPYVDMHGYEAEISQKFSDRFKGFVNYTYTNALDTRVNMQVADIPGRKLSYGLNYAGQDGISANLAVRYVGPVRSMYSQGTGNGSGDGNGNVDYTTYYWRNRNLPGYHVVDLKLSKTMQDKEYYVKAYNLLDKKYYQGAYLAGPGRYIEVGAIIKL